MRQGLIRLIQDRDARKRLFALALLVSFVVVSLLSEAFILAHANHRHDHNGAAGACAACARVKDAEDALRQLGTAIKTAVVAFLCLFAVTLAPRPLRGPYAALTPISLKIRMNN